MSRRALRKISAGLNDALHHALAEKRKAAAERARRARGGEVSKARAAHVAATAALLKAELRTAGAR